MQTNFNTNIWFQNCQLDAKTFFETTVERHFDDITGDRWYIGEPLNFYWLSSQFNSSLVISGGRDTCKSTWHIYTLIQDAITMPDETELIIYPNEMHMLPVMNLLEKEFRDDPYFAMYQQGQFKRKSPAYAKFKTGFEIYFRVVGIDVSGERAGVGIHVKRVRLDEAQLIPNTFINELLPTLVKNAKLFFSGVSNDDRSSSLFNAIEKDEFCYYKYPGYEGPNWDEVKEKRYIEQYGGKGATREIAEKTDIWQRQIEGKWGAAATSIFHPTSVQRAQTIHEYKHDVLFTKHAEEYIKHLTLPRIPEFTTSVDIGIDIGGSGESGTSEIFLLANKNKKIDIFDNDGQLLKTYNGLRGEIFYRITLKKVNTSKLKYLFDYVFCAYSSKLRIIGIDAHVVGNDTYYDLIDSKLFPGRHYDRLIIPVIPGADVIIGADPEHTDSKGNFLPIKMQSKTKATIELQDMFAYGTIAIPVIDTEIIKGLLNEKEAPRNVASTRHQIKYINEEPELEHLVDALRMVAFARWMHTDGKFVNLDAPKSEFSVATINKHGKIRKY